ncbi:MAG: EAL domain-containing protein [Colwellia sp.]
MNISLLAKKSLRAKLMLILMLLAVLITLLTSLIFSAYEIRSAKSSEKHRIQSIAEIIAPSLTASILFEDKETAQELITPLKNQMGVVDVVVYDRKGQVFFNDTEKEKIRASFQEDLNKVTTALLFENTIHGELVIWTDNSRVKQQVSFIANTLFIMLFVTLVISFVISLFLSKKFTQPIIALVETANKVTKSNNYNLRVNNTNHDELGDLTTCFNSMLETIEQRELNLESQVLERTGELKIAYENLKTANEQLKEQAYTDSLSGLPNRRCLLELMNTLIHQDKAQPFSIMYLDLDGFKDVNDSLGHDVGDALLISASKRIQSAVRSEDVLARLGGDEFTVLLECVEDKEVLSHIANNIKQVLSKPFFINGEEIQVSASIGISGYPLAGYTVEEVMKKADIAMFDAKDHGRNTYRFFEAPMLKKIQTKRQILEDLRNTLHNQGFELYYQPIINMRTGKIDKAEALIRWNHPLKGFIPPDEFIPLAEEYGLIDDIGCWVTEQAIVSTKKFREQYAPDIKICINVSPIQFKPESRWLNYFQHCLNETKIDQTAISIEITENFLMDSNEQTLDKLMLLESSGIEIAIDDFGVGYSSLSYLQKLKTDIIKIDRSFVQLLARDDASNTLCRTIVSMAKNLKMRVVAEGIETQEQCELLASYGCHYGPVS